MQKVMSYLREKRTDRKSPSPSVMGKKKSPLRLLESYWGNMGVEGNLEHQAGIEGDSCHQTLAVCLFRSRERP